MSIDNIIKLAEEHDVLELAVKLFSIYPEIQEASGSSKPNQHHYGDGGLIKHTEEVIQLCMLNADFFKDVYKINRRVLFLAALFHDVGKIYDYEKVNGVWQGAKHKRLVHHISRSALIWYNIATCYCKYDNDFIDSVLHCILSHHGMREWGSPVSPLTREAWLLHLCDGISARTYDCDTLDITKR
jgi:3'-5' exoribonuclease